MNPLWYPVILAMNAACLIGAGSIIRRHWTSRRDIVPIFVAFILLAGAIGLYISVAGMLWFNAIPDYSVRLQLSGWSLLFGILTVAYFAFGFLDSLAMRSVDRIGPMGVQIDDPSEFAAARKLALRGDIDGAVSMYRSYTDNQANALFEAVRLLKSEDRYVEASMLLNEIVDRFRHITRVWAEASYQLAKLKEHSLEEPQSAAKLFKEIIERAPDSTICQMAGVELARLHQLDKSYYNDDDEDETEEVTAEQQDPFYKNMDARALRGAGSQVIVPVQQAKSESNAQTDSRSMPGAASAEDADEMPMPAADPFYAVRKNPEGGAADSSQPQSHAE